LASSSRLSDADAVFLTESIEQLNALIEHAVAIRHEARVGRRAAQWLQMPDSRCKQIPSSSVSPCCTGGDSDWPGSGRLLVFNKHISSVLLRSKVRSGAQASASDKGTTGGLRDGNCINQITRIQSVYDVIVVVLALFKLLGAYIGLDAFTLS